MPFPGTLRQPQPTGEAKPYSSLNPERELFVSKRRGHILPRPPPPGVCGSRGGTPEGQPSHPRPRSGHPPPSPLNEGSLSGLQATQDRGKERTRHRERPYPAASGDRGEAALGPSDPRVISR